MKTNIKAMLAILALGTSALVATAQDSTDSTTTADQPQHGHRPPPNPVCMALDTNHDGVIDADEIANAPAALKTLDKNGDGQLTQDELRPQRPAGASDSGDQRPPGPPPGDE